MSSGCPGRPSGNATPESRRQVVLHHPRAHVGFDQPGSDAIHPHAGGCALLGERLGERVHARLGHIVRRTEWGADIGADRRHENDRAGALVDQMFRRRLAGVERAVQVDREHAVPVLDVHVPHRLRARGNAGIRHHDIEPAEGREHLRHHALDLQPFRNVGTHRERPATQLLDRLRRGARRRLVAPIVDRYARAGARQLERDAAPDPARPAGHQRELAAQPSGVVARLRHILLVRNRPEADK